MTSGPRDDRHWIARADVFERSTATALILLPHEGDAVELRGPAALIWELVGVHRTDDEIATQIATALGQPVAEIEPLVADTLQLLLGAELVQGPVTR